MVTNITEEEQTHIVPEGSIPYPREMVLQNKLNVNLIKLLNLNYHNRIYREEITWGECEIYSDFTY